MATSPGTARASAARWVLYHALNSASRSGLIVALTTKSAGRGMSAFANLARVLAGLGRGASDPGAPAVKGQGQRDQLVLVAWHGLQHADRRRLGQRHGLGQRVDGRAGHAGLLEEIDPLALRAGPEDALDL